MKMTTQIITTIKISDVVVKKEYNTNCHSFADALEIAAQKTEQFEDLDIEIISILIKKLEEEEKGAA